MKPENILVEMRKDAKICKNIRITDFGLSKMMAPEDKHYDMCGTFAYVAPEILMQQGAGYKADIWSIGVILYLMLGG